MLTASPITRQTVGKTFTIAISVLGTGAILQVGIIAWAFAMRPRPAVTTFAVATPASVPPVARLGKPSPDLNTPDLNGSPFADNADAGTAPAVPGTPPKPTPVQVTQKTPSAEPVNRFEELVLQGKQLRERGDMNTAITKFREASMTDPKNPIPIAELAATFEKMGSLEKAGEQWRRVYDMGDAAGVYYSLADAKLKATQAQALQQVAQQQATTTAPDAPPDPNAPVEGIAPGATLGLMPITLEDERDDASAKKFTLHVPIKARPKAKVDVKDLVIHVLFYDIVDDRNVVQTSANVNSRWATAPADWADSDTEELAVEYQLPKPEPRAAKRENRKFFGYIVRIYYKQRLQASASEPDRLAQQYPPPPTLPKEPEK